MDGDCSTIADFDALNRSGTDHSAVMGFEATDQRINRGPRSARGTRGGEPMACRQEERPAPVPGSVGACYDVAAQCASTARKRSSSNAARTMSEAGANSVWTKRCDSAPSAVLAIAMSWRRDGGGPW